MKGITGTGDAARAVEDALARGANRAVDGRVGPASRAVDGHAHEPTTVADDIRAGSPSDIVACHAKPTTADEAHAGSLSNNDDARAGSPCADRPTSELSIVDAGVGSKPTSCACAWSPSNTVDSRAGLRWTDQLASELAVPDNTGNELTTSTDGFQGGSLRRAIDALAAAVDRLFVTELRRGLADEETLELVATSLDLAAAVRSSAPARSTDRGEVTCSG